MTVDFLDDRLVNVSSYRMLQYGGSHEGLGGGISIRQKSRGGPYVFRVE